MGLPWEMKYKKGEENLVDDALSRVSSHELHIYDARVSDQGL